MATVASLADDVHILTNRPDLVSETNLAIRKAIFKFHSADTFKRDLAIRRLQMSSYLPVSADVWQWTIPLSEFPRFRRPKFLRYPTDLRNQPIQTPAPLIDWPGLSAWTGAFVEVNADDLFDRYSTEKYNYFFIAGSTLTIKASYEFDYLDLGYYQYPVVPSTGSIDSWICDQYPDAVIEEAAGTVFKMIGKDDEYNRYAQLFAENIAILRGTDVGEGV